MADTRLADGIMIIFNDPIPCADHTERAVRLALDMRDKVEGLAKKWARKSHDLSHLGSLRATQRSAANRIETMKGPAESGHAQQVKAGVLTCDVSEGMGYIIGSQKAAIMLVRA
jgi:class 3 adenylate cyclase